MTAMAKGPSAAASSELLVRVGDDEFFYDSVESFAAANPELALKVRCMGPGDFLDFGGGATPEVEVRRLAPPGTLTIGTLTIGSRVRVCPKRREQWSAAAVEAVDGRTGIVDEFHVLAEHRGEPEKKTVLVVFDSVVPLWWGSAKRRARAFWFDLDEVDPVAS